MPFVVPFADRVRQLQSLIAADKHDIGRADHWGGGRQVRTCLCVRMSVHTAQVIDIRVRRTHLYEDAFSELSPANAPNLRHQVRVTMTNWAGAAEAGIDGGGVFREFLAEVVKDAFHPARGLFTVASHSGELYPNAASAIVYADDYKQHFYFLGRLLGKCIYEQQLMEMRFASFFLAKLQRLH
jgi:ubiquitin-protein ligase E3 C